MPSPGIQAADGGMPLLADYPQLIGHLVEVWAAREPVS